jgi:ubiquinone biosynthesis protein UbiJ
MMSAAVRKAPLLFTEAVESAFNMAVAMDPATRKRMQSLDGSVILISLSGIDLPLYILPGKQTSVLASYDGEHDVSLTGTPLAMMRMSLDSRSEDSLFAGDVRIEGDTELGQRFQAILMDMNIDWEEHLARISGDVIAHQLGNLARDFLAWGTRARTTLLRDSGDWLQEESRQTAGDTEVDHFNREVDELRSSFARLEARVQRLRQHLGAA